MLDFFKLQLYFILSKRKINPCKPNIYRIHYVYEMYTVCIQNILRGESDGRNIS